MRSSCFRHVAKHVPSVLVILTRLWVSLLELHTLPLAAHSYALLHSGNLLTLLYIVT